MALSLLFLGCERDEVQQPSSQTLSQQEAMNLFFKNYQRQKDDYRDAVVEKLLAMNDSTDIIFDLVYRYGRPQWHVSTPEHRKGGSSLFVPVYSPGQDRVSAVFGFVDSCGTTYLKIYDGNSPDTLVADFVQAYQQMLCPSDSFPTRLFKPLGGNTKDEIVVTTTCWDVYTSTDGGSTLNYQYQFCTTTVQTYTTPVVPMDQEIPTGGGIDANVPPPSSKPHILLTDLKAKTNLNNAETKLNDGPCLSQTVRNTTWNNSLTITINGGITEIARYNSLTGKLEFRDVGSITDRVMLHELLHAYQAKLYGKDYEHTRTHEFEAWLLVDLYLFSQNNDMNNLTWTRDIDSDKLKLDYYNWIKSIYENGFTSGLVGNSNMCTFWRDAFITAVPEYEKLPKGTTTFPSTIDNLISNCQKTVL